MNNYNKIELPYTISLNRYLGRAKNGITYKKKEALEYISKVDKVLLKNNIKASDKLLSVIIIQHPVLLKKKITDELYYLYQRRQDLDNINKVLLDSLQVTYNKDKSIFNDNKLYFNDKQIIDLKLIVGKPIKDGGIDFYYKFYEQEELKTFNFDLYS